MTLSDKLMKLCEEIDEMPDRVDAKIVRDSSTLRKLTGAAMIAGGVKGHFDLLKDVDQFANRVVYSGIIPATRLATKKGAPSDLRKKVAGGVGKLGVVGAGIMGKSIIGGMAMGQGGLMLAGTKFVCPEGYMKDPMNPSICLRKTLKRRLAKGALGVGKMFVGVDTRKKMYDPANLSRSIVGGVDVYNAVMGK